MQIAMGELGADGLRTLLQPGHDDGQNPADPEANGGGGGGQEPDNKRPKRRPSRGQSTADRVAKTTASHPDWSAAEVAKKLGIGERTARRYMTGH